MNRHDNKHGRKPFFETKSRGMRFAAISDPLRVGSHYLSWRCTYSQSMIPVRAPVSASSMTLVDDKSRCICEILGQCRRPRTGSRAEVERGPEPSVSSAHPVICRGIIFLSHVFSRERRIMHQVPKTMRGVSRGALSSITCALNVRVRIRTWFV